MIMRYHWSSVPFLFSVVLFGGFATPLSPRWNEMLLKHSWNSIPEKWECLGLPPVGTTVDLHLAFKPHRKNALIDVLNEVSNPRHPKYGAYLSREQVAELVAPHPDTIELVHSWLEYHRVSPSSVSVTHGGSSLTLAGVPVSRANDLLGASYQLYMHTETNETIVRTVGYSLPAALHQHVQTVAPTTYFSFSLTQWQIPRKRSGGATAGLVKSASGERVTMQSGRDGDAITPPFLRWLYSTFAYVPTSTKQNVLGITGYAKQYPSPGDLAKYMRKYRFSLDATFTVIQVNGGEFKPSDPGFQANLDTQLAGGMTYPTTHVFYSTGARPNGDPELGWLNYIFSQSRIPQTISTSYGNYEKNYPKDYATYVCLLYGQLGVLGVSVLFPSGNHGVGQGHCKTYDGTVQFTPLFPATCPWVTGVGGTTSHTPEVAASLSGGGFSNYFPTPVYQQRAVSTFLDGLGKQHEGLYNKTGRGIPDIAAQALGIPFFLKAKEEAVDGTSGSTPIVAGIISLLNDYRISEGKTPLGFLNPWLYGGGLQGFNDITSGSNPGCNTVGFSAIKGWDPVTGLGTPDFERLQFITDFTDFPRPGN